MFRLVLGYTRPELAACTAAADPAGAGVTEPVVRTMEGGGRPRGGAGAARHCARAIAAVMEGRLFPSMPPGALRTKQQKPDTTGGWETVRRFATEGVPYEVLLHQRAYGGAFRQLADAGSGAVGEVLEGAVAQLLAGAGIDFVHTGSATADKAAVAERFGLHLALVPDFVVHRGGALRAFVECKTINDGGTARDKAARFAHYRQEGQRLGGVPVFAILDGRGWQRVSDALGPVVAACDGRVFTGATLPELLTVDPFPELAAAGPAQEMG